MFYCTERNVATSTMTYDVADVVYFFFCPEDRYEEGILREFCLKSSTTECVFLLPPSDSVVRPFVSILNKWLKFIDFQ